MANEFIELNLIPTGDKPVFHAAQYDVGRPIIIHLKNGEDDFTPTDLDLELQVRKVDNNIVTAVPDSVLGNVVTFLSTQQMTACSGTNLCVVQLSDNDHTIATLHFFLVVQRDVLNGGISSASEIHDLTEQIAEIVPEVIGDDYYNKEEVDEKIAEIPTFDPTNYYNKSDVDTLLSNKADKSIVNAIELLPTVKSVSGSVATFDTDLTDNLIECKCNIMYQQASGTPTPDNPLPITVNTSLNLSHSDDDVLNPTVINIPFGRSVSKGVLNVTTGLLTVTGGYIDLSSLTYTVASWGAYRAVLPNAKPTLSSSDVPNAACENYSVTYYTNLNQNKPNNYFAFGISGSSVLIYVIADNLPTGYLVYDLVEPQTYQLTPNEVIQLLNENNIWCDTNGDTSVKYTLTIGKSIS